MFKLLVNNTALYKIHKKNTAYSLDIWDNESEEQITDGIMVF